MNIPKAIEILQDLTRYSYSATGPDAEVALKLSIEALNRIKDDRVINPDLNPYPLPSETEE